MERTIYSDGVLVDNTMLNRTELTKATEILRGRLDWTSRGVYSGGRVSVAAADDTRVDIAAFSGFVPTGDYVECTGNLASIQLSSSTSGVTNYVCAFYTETQDFLQPHETDGHVYPTRAKGSYRVHVYTQAEFEALPVTNPTLAVDAQDRALVLAHVVANGVSTSLTSASITGPTVYSNILYSTPRVLTTISGIEVISVSSGTSTGSGSMAFTYAASVYTLQWTPHGGTAGAAVDISTDGDYYIYDGGATEYVEVKVVVSQLPVLASLSESVNITNMYYQSIPRQTAEDSLHRNLVGSGVPRPTNPHGLSMDDLSGESLSLLDEHQDVMHCNGIWKGSSAGALSTAITHVSPADILTTVAPTGADLYYINGKKLTGIDRTTITFDFPTHTSHMYEIFVTGSESLQTNLKASYPTSRTVTGTWIVDTSEGYPAGTYDLECVVAAGQASFTFSWDGGQQVMVTRLTPDRAIRLYAEDGINWIDLWVRSSVMGSTDAHLPGAGATYTDTVTVAASPLATTNMVISTVAYWYDPVALVGRLGYPPYASGAGVTRDRRPYGTLCVDNISDAALKELIYAPLDEYQQSGVLLGRDVNVENTSRPVNFSKINISGLDIDVSGGHAYCRGKRLTVEKMSLTLNASVTSLIYIDVEGVIKALDVSAAFSGDIDAALRYLLGCSTDRPALEGLHRYDDPSPYDVPERGVPLWSVHTGTTSITASYDMMRNVGGGIRPWTVANRRFGYAAFDSLYAAFHYATVLGTYDLLKGIEVLVVGVTTVKCLTVQPANVYVRGVGVEAGVRILFASTLGAWRLSQGCKVRDLRIHTEVGGTASLGLSSSCVVEGCIFVASIYRSGVYTFAEVGGAGTCSGILIVDNSFSVMSAVFDPSFVTAGRDLVTFRDNKVSTNTANVDTASRGLVAFRAEQAICTGNYVSSVNSTSHQQAAIYVAADVQGTVANNHVIIGETSATGPAVVGVHVTTLGSSNTPMEVVNNTIIPDVRATAIWCTGIKVDSATSGLAPGGRIAGNKLGYVGTGISVAGGVKDLRISSNVLYRCDYVGILVEDDVSAGVNSLDISDNNISGSVRTATVTNFGDNSVYGIRAYTEASGGGANAVSIKGNKLNSLSNSVGNLYGIKYLVYGTSNRIEGNEVVSLSGGAAYGTYGIYGYSTSAVSSDKQMFCAGNTVRFQSAILSASTGTAVGILWRYSSVSHFCDNEVVLTGANVTDKGAAMQLSHLLEDCMVAGNILQGLEKALYLVECDAVVSGGRYTSHCVGILDAGRSSNSLCIRGAEVEVASRYGYYDGAHTLGSYGIFSESGASVVIEDSRVKVVPVGSSGSEAVVNSTAFVLTQANAVNIRGNRLGPVDGIETSSSSSHLLRVVLSSNSVMKQVEISDNLFDNYKSGGSNINSVKVDVSGFNTSDVYKVHFKSNTFKVGRIGSAHQWGSNSNPTGLVEVELVQPVATPAQSEVVWTGNSLDTFLSQGSSAPYSAPVSRFGTINSHIYSNETNHIPHHDLTALGRWW